jgi:DNA-binding response OmpR family regulator
MEKKRILIADDDESFLMGLALRLRKEGFKVFTAQNSHGALAQAMVQRPDVIITDINMPGGDGFTITERLWNLGWDEPPIIYITGENSSRIETRLWQFDARQVLYKPFDTHELLRTVNEVLTAS